MIWPRTNDYFGHVPVEGGRSQRATSRWRSFRRRGAVVAAGVYFALVSVAVVVLAALLVETRADRSKADAALGSLRERFTDSAEEADALAEENARLASDAEAATAPLHEPRT